MHKDRPPHTHNSEKRRKKKQHKIENHKSQPANTRKKLFAVPNLSVFFARLQLLGGKKCKVIEHQGGRFSSERRIYELGTVFNCENYPLAPTKMTEFLKLYGFKKKNWELSRAAGVGTTTRKASGKASTGCGINRRKEILVWVLICLLMFTHHSHAHAIFCSLSSFFLVNQNCVITSSITLRTQKSEAKPEKKTFKSFNIESAINPKVVN